MLLSTVYRGPLQNYICASSTKEAIIIITMLDKRVGDRSPKGSGLSENVAASLS